jgi:hypothetical protein
MMDSGSPILAGFFFILLVFLGAYFLLNVILVVIISNYSDTKNIAAGGGADRKYGENDQQHTSISSYRKDNSALSSDAGGADLSGTMPLTARKEIDHSEIPPILLNDGQLVDGNLSDFMIQKEPLTVEGIKSNRSFQNNPEGAGGGIFNNRSHSLKPIAEMSSNQNNAGNTPARKSSLPIIDRVKNSTPIIDMEEVISNEGAGRVFREEDGFENRVQIH